MVYGVLLFHHLLCLLSSVLTDHLAHVHMIFRHGDRSSITPYVFNGYDPYAVWPEGFGQLTQKGIEQHFILGKWLRSKYSNFIKADYNVSTFHMRSSDIDRALMSAQSLMAGLFNESNSSLSKYGLNWRPIPIHTVSLNEDTLLSLAPCARMDQRREELLKSDAGVDLFKAHEKTITIVGNFYGIKNIGLKDIWKIGDDLFCLKSHNLKVPSWYTSVIAEEIDLILSKMFELYFTDLEVVRLGVGVFLKDAFDRMSAFIHKRSNSTTVNPGDRALEQMMGYSAHDTNVAPLLGAFGLYAGEAKPAYASLVALELFAPSDAQNHGQENDYLLRLHYKRGYNDLHGQYLQFAACRGRRKPEEGCPFGVVRESLASLVLSPEAAEEACRAAWLPSHYRLIAAATLGAFVVLLLLFLGTAYFITFQHRRNNPESLDTNFGASGHLPYSSLVESSITA